MTFCGVEACIGARNVCERHCAFVVVNTPPPLLTAPSCKPVLAEDGAPAPLVGTAFEGYESGAKFGTAQPSTFA